MVNHKDLIEKCMSISVNHPESCTRKDLILKGFEGEVFEDSFIQVSSVYPVPDRGFTKVVYNGEEVYEASRDIDVFDEEDFDPSQTIVKYVSGDWEKRIDEIYEEVMKKL